jgi:hypothetical protein
MESMEGHRLLIGTSLVISASSKRLFGCQLPVLSLSDCYMASRMLTEDANLAAPIDRV